MIIATLLEPALNQTANAFNGATAVVFYTMNDAIIWARLQSAEQIAGGSTIRAWVSVVNTDTEVVRWWYNGVEHTG
jgi:hypothetical protein